LTLEERLTAAKEKFVFLFWLSCLRLEGNQVIIYYSFRLILQHENQKRYKRLAIAHFSMGCNMDAKPAKIKPIKLVKGKKRWGEDDIILPFVCPYISNRF